MAYVVKSANERGGRALSLSEARAAWTSVEDPELWSVDAEIGEEVDSVSTLIVRGEEPVWSRLELRERGIVYRHKDDPDSFWARMRDIHGDDVGPRS